MLFQNLACTRKTHRVQLVDRKFAHSGVIWNILSISKFMKNYASYMYKFIYTCKFMVMRESIPRQVDKKSPRRERSGILKEEERTNVFFFFSTFMSVGHIKHFFFSLSPEVIITQQTTQFKLCTKDYITTVYPA